MKYRIIKPRNMTAEIRIPASKSISGRALILNAITGAPPGLVSNISDCDDTTVTMEALFLLDMERREGAACMMPPKVNVRAAGTAMRFLTALFAITPGTHTLTGTDRLCHRPIGILVEALRTMGAEIEYLGEEGFPPLDITGKKLRGGTLQLAGNVSSQFISALLMIAPCLSSDLTLQLTGDIVSLPYINMTVAMMREHGATVKWVDDHTLHVKAKRYRPTPYTIESDWSAASYWYEMVLLSDNPDETATLKGLFKKSLQGDSAVYEMFHALSVQSLFLSSRTDEPKVTLIRRGSLPDYVEWDFTATPDLAQTMVVTCAMKGIPFCFSGLQSLRIKETDRIAALVTELAKLGVRLEVEGDSIIRWAGPDAQPKGEISYLQPLPDTAIDTYEDHRMAMAFAPAAMVLGSIDINHPEVVSKSYPRFWDDLKQVGFEIVESQRS